MEALLLEKTMGAKLDLTGKRFGKLVALESVHHRGVVAWVCICDCGNKTRSTTGSLNAGVAKSCGCVRKSEEFKAATAKRNTKHGLYGTVEYATWNAIITRCENNNEPSWTHYGGRGISVDPRWRNSPEQFLKDMGKRPGKGWSIERKDVNGNYSPENCVWATAKEQGNNTRFNVKYTYKGVTKNLGQWAEEYGLSYNTLADRLKARGNSIIAALEFVPLPRAEFITYKGQTKKLTDWAEELGFSRRGLTKRLRTMSVEEAFNKPKRIWPNDITK